MIRSRPSGLLLGAACLLSGCLVPAPIEEEPIEVNLPPYFIDGTVFPPLDEVREYDRLVDGDEVVFEVGFVDDPNAGDVLFYRWFVDPSAASPNLEDQGELTPNSRDAIPLEYRPCIAGRRSDDGTVQRVELVVSDRAFLDGNSQEVPEEAGVLRLTWFVRLNGCP